MLRMSKGFCWVMVLANLVLLYLVAKGQMMIAMYLMAIIMLVDAVLGLVGAYRK
ncbi:hypothetical protein [Lacticaseibacillus songhuajiangensis]|uniref:hypothetical protein n=1 Tax=Lacticaseibacillus songhuajiangensis TaxID=1296539 RepID=UPI0013DE3487|nr:hypothetical protein [Lacticaseibacillus songhuajiangensis]